MIKNTARDLGRNNLLVMLALFIWALGEGLWYQNLRTLYLQELGALPTQIGLAEAIASIARAAPLIPTGYLADRFGPYRVMIASWLLGIVGPVLMALASTWQQAVPGLAIYSLSAFALPSITTYALLSIPNKNAHGIDQRTLTAVFASYPAGLAISQTVGGQIAQMTSIRTCLWIAAGIFTVSLIVILLAQHIDPPPAHHEEVPLALARNRRFITLAMYYAAVALTFQVGYALVSNYFHQARGFGYAIIGILYSIGSIGTVIITLGAGRIDRRWSYALVILIVWLGVIGTWQAQHVALAGAAFFGMGGMWSARSLAAAGISSVVRPRNRGLAFGVMDTLLAIVYGIAGVAAGWLYEQTPGHDLPLIAEAVGLPIMLALWLAVRRSLGADRKSTRLNS